MLLINHSKTLLHFTAKKCQLKKKSPIKLIVSELFHFLCNTTFCTLGGLVANLHAVVNYVEKK